MLSDRDYLPRSWPGDHRHRHCRVCRSATLRALGCYNPARNGRILLALVSRTALRRPRLPAVISTAVIPREADRVVILINPKAGAKAVHPRAQRLAELLRKQGFHAELLSDLAAATAQANQWHAEGILRALVGAGGDGTAAELVNRTAEGVPITLLPAGNSNLLARHFHISRDPEALCQHVGRGRFGPDRRRSGQRPNLLGDGQLRLRRRRGPARPRPPNRPRHRLFLLQADRRGHLEL